MAVVLVGCGKEERKAPPPWLNNAAPAEAAEPSDPYVVPSEVCAGKPACGETGRCNALKGGGADDCIAGNDAMCAKSVGCKTKGRCRAQHPSEEQMRTGFTLFSWDCTAKTVEDCKQVEICKSAECQIKDGACEAKPSAAACRASEGCKDYGRCSVKDGECAVGSDADCLDSKWCRRDGSCAAGKDGCEARTAAHCAQSEVCKSDGRCTPDGRGSCGCDKNTDCRKYESCKKSGDCSLLYMPIDSGGHKAWVCTSASAADCKQSEGCAVHGECSFVGDKKSYGTCRAGSDADCKKSKDCRDKGACKLVTDEYGSKSCGS